MTDTMELEKRVAEFRVRLFLSVDLSGSTAFKSSKVGEGRDDNRASPRWVTHFEQFYLNFSDMFQAKYQSLTTECEIEDACPKLWRTAGDELVFCGRVTSQLSVILMLEAFILTLTDYRKSFIDASVSLDLKGTAWIATFPEPNRSVQVLRGTDELKLVTASEALEKEADLKPFAYDFLGKSMDTGFRVARAAMPERFTLSVQLAKVILDFPDSELFKRKIRLDRPVLLKGVNGGEPYPILFVDTMEHLTSANVKRMERVLLGRADAPCREKLKDYLSAYCDDVGTEEVCLPMLTSDGPVTPSAAYLEHKDKIAAHLLKLVAYSQGEEESDETDGDEKELKATGDLKALRNR